MQTVSFARILGTFLCFSKESTASIYFCVLWLEIKKRVFANFTHIFHGTTHIRVAVLLIVGIIALTQKWVMNDGGEECTMDYSDIYVERIRKLCNERGIAINKLATMSDVKQSTLDNIAGWLKVVMDAVQEENLGASVLSLWDETNKIANIWGNLLVEKNIKIHINPQTIPADNEFLFKIAVADLYVIVNNFILNSVYFFEKEEQDSREISITFLEDESVIAMTMENNGPALDERYHRHPMQIFEIGESTKPQGTGLGLWLMRDAAERNDGQIDVLNKATGFGIKIEWKK